tara:strand:- start:4098 stop:6416 length:2319 start_codon:yes stop_codon:yes gene_type:complete
VAVSNVELRVNATQAVTALKNVDGQAKKFNTTISGTSGKLKATTGSLKVLPAGLIATGGGAKVAAGGFGALTAAAAPLLGPLIGISAAVGALTKVFGNLSVQDFASAKIKTLGVDADALKPKLATLSNELSGQASSLDLLAASYDIASAGFGETAELTDVLKASQLGATGGFSELATVADATTSVLNAYGLSSDQASKLVDGFIQTQNDGKIVVDQYAQQIGRLAPIAAGAGVGIDELNAAISTVTATGVPVESTFAGLRQVIAAIQKPTSEASKAAEKLGIDFSATALSTKGLGGVLEELVAKGGASEETLAQFFGSVEARTALLPLVNDQLVSFNKNLDNQANAQGKAAEASVTSSNTIKGQLTRLGTAFTNLTTDGSEIGIVIRESLKIAAVTVEALAAAFKLVLAPVRAIFAAVGEIGKQIGKAIGIDATKTLFNLEQGWIGIKERVTEVSDKVIFAGKVIGGVYANIYKKIFGFLKGIADGTKNIFIGIIDTFKGVVQGIVDAINGNPILKRLFGGLANIKLDFDISGIKNFGKDFLKGAQEKAEKLKNTVIEFSGVEKEITEENNKQIDAKNKILDTNGKIKKSVDQITEAEKKAKEEADKLKDKFMKIGEDIEKGIVSNLADAVEGTKTLAEAAVSVLNDLKRKLIEVAIQQAVSGIGGKIGGFLGKIFSGKKERGGRVNAGGAFLVGERGPEILQMGSKGGNIIPNSQIGGGGDSVVNNISVSVDASGSAVSGSSAGGNELGQQIAVAIQTELIKQKRAGGLLA